MSTDAEYTPSTDEVREMYQNGTWNDGLGTYDTAAGFDRWLAAHDAEVWADALMYASESVQRAAAIRRGVTP